MYGSIYKGNLDASNAPQKRPFHDDDPVRSITATSYLVPYSPPPDLPQTALLTVHQ